MCKRNHLWIVYIRARRIFRILFTSLFSWIESKKQSVSVLSRKERAKQTNQIRVARGRFRWNGRYDWLNGSGRVFRDYITNMANMTNTTNTTKTTLARIWRALIYYPQVSHIQYDEAGGVIINVDLIPHNVESTNWHLEPTFDGLKCLRFEF
jgi:hypothetical protein